MPLTGEYKPGTSEWARVQAEKFEETNGTEANLLRCRPIIVLTTVGVKTGALRKIALMRVEHEGVYAIVASKGGADKAPTWLWNVRANPHVELQDGEVKRDYLAREVSGDERALLLERAVEAWPPYADYQTKTDRLIQVFVLDPLESPEA